MPATAINPNAFCYIREQCSYPEDNVNFGYTTHKVDGRFYLKFPAVLQSFGIKNRNNRFYDANNVWQCIVESEYIQSMLRQNSWLGEYDHPAETLAGTKLTVQRIANPDPKHSSHYIRSPRLEGNLLKGNIQTDSATEEGMNLAIKMVDGKIIPAFSARVLGELQNRNGNPTVWVKRLVTYDAVLYPSHREALGNISQSVLMESVNAVEQATGVTIIFLTELAQMAANASKETEWLCESFGLGINDIVGLTGTGNSVVISEGANMYVQPLTDKRIRNRTQEGLRDFLGGGKRS